MFLVFFFFSLNENSKVRKRVRGEKHPQPAQGTQRGACDSPACELQRGRCCDGSLLRRPWPAGRPEGDEAGFVGAPAGRDPPPWKALPGAPAALWGEALRGLQLRVGQGDQEARDLTVPGCL